jgi:hypothetical protein
MLTRVTRTAVSSHSVLQQTTRSSFALGKNIKGMAAQVKTMVDEKIQV